MNNFTQAYTDFNEHANIWMHRCNHYGKAAWEILGYDYSTNVFSDKNCCYISIGCDSGKWSKDTYNNIKKMKSSEQKDAFEMQFDELYKGRKKPKYRNCLYRFFFEFRKDNYIVVPSGGEFHVFRIENDEILTYEDEEIAARFNQIGFSDEVIKDIKDKNYDFKFFRKVKPIRVQIPRKGYATGDLCSKLKYQGTNLEIRDEASNELKKALEADAPFSIYNTSINCLKEKLYEALTKINPDQFESLIAWYFRKKGADIYDVLPKNYADKVEYEDADVLAVFEDLKLRIFVQAKAYKGKSVDLSGAKNQLEEYMNYHVLNKENNYTNVMWIVCLAKSDNEINDIERIKKANIRVVNGTEFAEMLINAGLQDIDSALK